MATITTPLTASPWRPDVNVFAAQDVIPDALIMQTSTIGGKIEGDAVMVAVAYIDDATATFVAEGTDIPESEPSLSGLSVATGKVSQLVKISREQWTYPETPGLMADSVTRAVIRKANEAYLTQAAPVAPAVAPSTGLLNVADITNGGAVADDLDALVDLFATLQGEGATPTHLVIDPKGWAGLRKFKTATDSAQSLLGVGATDTQLMLFGVPVIVTSAMPANTGLVIDSSAVVSAVSDVEVATSEHALFGSDSIAIRCTFRFGQGVVKPERIGKFTVTAPAA